MTALNFFWTIRTRDMFRHMAKEEDNPVDQLTFTQCANLLNEIREMMLSLPEDALQGIPPEKAVDIVQRLKEHLILLDEDPDLPL